MLAAISGLKYVSLELTFSAAAPAYARSFTADGGQTVAAAGCGRHLVSSPEEKRGESSPRRASCSDHQSAVSFRANCFDSSYFDVQPGTTLIVTFCPRQSSDVARVFKGQNHVSIYHNASGSYSQPQYGLVKPFMQSFPNNSDPGPRHGLHADIPYMPRHAKRQRQRH